MRRTLVLIGALALLSGPAFAVCADPTTFGSTQGGCSTNTGLCGFLTPTGHSAADPAVHGFFWSWTTGNPTFGIGNDNGSWCSNCGTGTATDNSWFFDTGDPGQFVSFGTWNQDLQGQPISQDGCYTVVAPDTVPRMVMMATDQDATGHSFFAVGAALETPGFADQFDFSLTRGTGANGILMTLRPLPAPSITASANISTTDKQVTLAPVSAPISAFYTADPTILATDIIKGYKIYRQDVPFTKPAQPGPAARARSGFTAVGGLQTFGTAPLIDITCTSNVNVYLAYSIVFDGATPFETDVVSANGSTPVACGPTLADPGEHKFKVIDKRNPK